MTWPDSGLSGKPWNLKGMALGRGKSSGGIRLCCRMSWILPGQGALWRVPAGSEKIDAFEKQKKFSLSGILFGQQPFTW